MCLNMRTNPHSSHQSGFERQMIDLKASQKKKRGQGNFEITHCFSTLKRGGGGGGVRKGIRQINEYMDLFDLHPSITYPSLELQSEEEWSRRKQPVPIFTSVLLYRALERDAYLYGCMDVCTHGWGKHHGSEVKLKRNPAGRATAMLKVKRNRQLIRC